MPYPLSTKRLRLLPAEAGHLALLLEGDAAFTRRFRLAVARGYLQERALLPQLLRIRQEHPEWQPWWAYLFVHQQDRAVVGFGGYKGPADADGYVEIRYSIAPAYRKRGLATEAAAALTRFAMAQPGIAGVAAHTLAPANASARLLRRCGFHCTGKWPPRQDAQLWQWRRPRDANLRCGPG